MTNNVTFFSLLLSIVLLAGCEQANQNAPPPPPKITVALPQRQEVNDHPDFTGTVAASEYPVFR